MKYSYKSILAFLFAIILNGGCGDQKKVHPATATSSLKTSSKATPPADTPAGANASQNQEAEKKEDGTVKGGLDENPKEETKEEEEDDDDEEEEEKGKKDANETLNDGPEKDGDATSENQKSNAETQEGSNAEEQRGKLTLDEEIKKHINAIDNAKTHISKRLTSWINGISLTKEEREDLINFYSVESQNRLIKNDETINNKFNNYDDVRNSWLNGVEKWCINLSLNEKTCLLSLANNATEVSKNITDFCRKCTQDPIKTLNYLKIEEAMYKTLPDYREQYIITLVTKMTDINTNTNTRKTLISKLKNATKKLKDKGKKVTDEINAIQPLANTCSAFFGQ